MTLERLYVFCSVGMCWLGVCVRSWRNTGVYLSSPGSEQADSCHSQSKESAQDGHNRTRR